MRAPRKKNKNIIALQQEAFAIASFLSQPERLHFFVRLKMQKYI